MSKILYSFVVCSDIHTSNTTGGILDRYAEDQSIDFICCCGDFQPNTGGFYKSESVELSCTPVVQKIASFGGVICAGNHDSGAAYGTRSKDKSKETLTEAIEDWMNLISSNQNVKRPNGTKRVVYREAPHGDDLIVAISDIGGGDFYDGVHNLEYANEDVDWIYDKANELVDGKKRRIFLFLHYDYQFTMTPEVPSTEKYTTNGTVTAQWAAESFGFRFGTGQNGNFNYAAAYPSQTIKNAEAKKGNLFNKVLQMPNVIWFSGHCHNDWRLTNDVLTYQDGGNVYQGGNFKSIHFAKYPNGCWQVNLPSLRYRVQDAFVKVYDDHVEIIPRAGMINNQYVADTINPYTDTSGWSMVEMPSKYRYSISLAARNAEGGDDPTTTYTATFVAGEVVVDTVEFEAGVTVLPRVPIVPEKEGYTGEWEEYTVRDENFTVNAIYTQKPPSPTIKLYNYDNVEIFSTYNFDGEESQTIYNWGGDELND